VTDFKLKHPDGVIVALDQMSVYLQASLRRVWSPVGQTPLVRTTPQRDSLKWYGALEVESGYEVALALPKMNGENTVHFLKHLLDCIPQRPILLLWDRAPWHKGIARQFVDAHERLEMMYFPPACPDLNPQEHVWKHTREAVGHLHDYRHLSHLRQAFQTHLEQTSFRFNWIDKYCPVQSYKSVFI
jgi:transposase